MTEHMHEDPSVAPAAPHEVYTGLLSHELRTPVTLIFAYLQLLDDDRLFNDPKTLRKYLATVRRRAADLVRIVSELTEFTELVRGEDTNMQRSSARGLPDLIDELAAGRPMHAELSAEAAGVHVDLNRLHLI